MNAEKQTQISLLFLALRASGMTTEEAWNTLFPQIPFKEFAGKLWEELRKKQNLPIQ